MSYYRDPTTWVMGTETEFNIDIGVSHEVEEMYTGMGLDTTSPHYKAFLENGGALYLDISRTERPSSDNQIEWCTPEHGDPYTVALYEAVGEMALADVADEYGNALVKGNLASEGECTGYHENYWMPNLSDNGQLDSSLATFLYTRAALTGSGSFLGSQENATYVLSPRLHFLFENKLLSYKPSIARTASKHEDTGGRYHITIGDGNRSFFSSVLALGATALFLHLPLPDIRSPDEREFVLQMNRDLTCTNTYPFIFPHGQRTATVLDVQEEYLNAATRHFPDLPSNFQNIITLWEQMLETTKSESFHLSDSDITPDLLAPEWLVKYKVLQARNHFDSGTRDTASLEIEMNTIHGPWDDLLWPLPFNIDRHVKWSTSPSGYRSERRGNFIAKEGEYLSALGVRSLISNDWRLVNGFRDERDDGDIVRPHSEDEYSEWLPDPTMTEGRKLEEGELLPRPLSA